MDANIIVISLLAAIHRRERMRKILNKRGLPFCFFDAVDGRDPLTHERAIAELPNASKLYPGEIGCALSHIDVWKQIAAADDNNLTLILEDDVHLSVGFEDVWRAVTANRLPSGIYRFETMLASVSMGINPVWTGPSCSFYPMLSAHGGTAGYALDKQAASNLLLTASKLCEAIDIELFHASRSNIQPPFIYQAYPALVIQDMLIPKGLQSEILRSTILLKRDIDLYSTKRNQFKEKYWSHVQRMGRPLLNLLRSVQLRPRGMFRRRIAFSGPMTISLD